MLPIDIELPIELISIILGYTTGRVKCMLCMCLSSARISRVLDQARCHTVPTTVSAVASTSRREHVLEDCLKQESIVIRGITRDMGMYALLPPPYVIGRSLTVRLWKLPKWLEPFNSHISRILRVHDGEFCNPQYYLSEERVMYVLERAYNEGLLNPSGSSRRDLTGSNSISGKIPLKHLALEFLQLNMCPK